MYKIRLTTLLSIPLLALIGSCGGGGSTSGAGISGGQEAGTPPETGNSGTESQKPSGGKSDTETEAEQENQKKQGSDGGTVGIQGVPGSPKQASKKAGGGSGGGLGGISKGSGGSGGGSIGSGGGSGNPGSDSQGSGGSQGENGSGENESGEGGNQSSGSGITAEISSLEQDGGLLRLNLEVVGTGQVRLVATEGDRTDTRIIETAGLSNQKFRIPRRGEPLSLRQMTLEAFDDQGALLAVRQLETVEPLDLPSHSLLALNLVDQRTLQTRFAQRGRAQRVLTEMLAGLDDQLAQTLFIPDTKGEDGNYYRCPEHGDPLSPLPKDPTRHKCPVDGFVYGPNNTDPILYQKIQGAYNSRLHRDLANEAFEMGVGFVLTENLVYAQRAADILMGYSARYLNYELRDRFGRTNTRATARVLSQSLDEARWLIQLSRAMDLIRGTGVMTETQEQTVLSDLFRPSCELLRSKRAQWGIHNIQCWHNTAVFFSAMLLEDYQTARDSIWADFGLADQLGTGLLKDGIWSEGSFGYHYFAVRAILPMMQALRRGGITMDEGRLREMLLTPVRMIQPDGSLPMVNDGSWKSFSSNLKDLYEQAAGLFDEPEMAAPLVKYGRGNTVEGIVFGLRSVKTGGWQDPASMNMPKSGFSTLRAGSLAEQTMALIDYGPHGGDHGHLDKMGIMLWMNGTVVLREAGHNGYAEPWYKGWYKRTLAHSTILRDGIDQKEVADGGQIRRFETVAGATTSVSETDKAYPGNVLQRLIHTTPNGRFADVFEVQGTASHVWDYVLHGEGQASINLNMQSVSDVGYGGAYAFLKNIKSATTDGDFEITFKSKKGNHTVRVLGYPGTQVILAEAPGFPSNRRHPILIVRREGTQALFASFVTEGSTLPAGLTLTLDALNRQLTIREPEANADVVLKLE
jgi:heparinase II/III-like protein